MRMLGLCKNQHNPGVRGTLRPYQQLAIGLRADAATPEGPESGMSLPPLASVFLSVQGQCSLPSNNLVLPPASLRHQTYFASFPLAKTPLSHKLTHSGAGWREQERAAGLHQGTKK